jgi:hypothetical protein
MALGLIGAGWLASPAAAQGAPEQPFAESSAAARAQEVPDDAHFEAKIRAALGKPTHMEFVETPLEDAVDFLKDLHAIEIQLDSKALESAGIGSDTPLTGTLKGVSLGSALRLLLRSLEMTYVVRDGVLLITTPKAVGEMTELRVYDVRELAKDENQADQLATIVRLALAPDGVSGGGHAAGDVRQAAVASDAPLQPAPIARASVPQIATFGNLIVVRASVAEQAAVSALLAEMRQNLKPEAK